MRLTECNRTPNYTRGCGAGECVTKRIANPQPRPLTFEHSYASNHTERDRDARSLQQEFLPGRLRTRLDTKGIGHRIRATRGKGHGSAFDRGLRSLWR